MSLSLSLDSIAGHSSYLLVHVTNCPWSERMVLSLSSSPVDELTNCYDSSILYDVRV